MEIQSRLLTVDFYDCKGDRCSTEEALRDQVSDALRTVGLSPIEIISSGQESGVLSLLALVPGGHVALHAPRLPRRLPLSGKRATRPHRPRPAQIFPTGQDQEHTSAAR